MELTGPPMNRAKLTPLLDVLVTVALAIVCFWPAQTIIIGDGGFEVAVQVLSELDGIRSISCTPFGDQSQAEDAVRLQWTERPPDSYGPLSGKPIRVGIQSSDRTTPSGQDLSRFWEKHLVVIAVFHDGRRIAKRVEIPDGAERVSLTLP
jgi:hypothetical protein